MFEDDDESEGGDEQLSSERRDNIKRYEDMVQKKEDYFFDVDDELMAEIMVFSKRVAVAIKKATNCRRVGVAVIGFEVPHAHLHLVPMNGMSDINFANPKLKLSQEDLAGTSKKINSFLK